MAHEIPLFLLADGVEQLSTGDNEPRQGRDGQLQKSLISGVSDRIRMTKPSTTTRMAGPGKPGRPSKGDRKIVTTKIPTSLITLADDEAKQRGLDRTAIFVEALAAKYGVSAPFTQEQLPLTDAA